MSTYLKCPRVLIYSIAYLNKFYISGGFTITLQKVMMVVRPKTNQTKVFFICLFSFLFSPEPHEYAFAHLRQ